RNGKGARKPEQRTRRRTRGVSSTVGRAVPPAEAVKTTGGFLFRLRQTQADRSGFDSPHAAAIRACPMSSQKTTCRKFDLMGPVARTVAPEELWSERPRGALVRTTPMSFGQNDPDELWSERPR
ncbi:MAG: hypothetical protein BJ554DRAFT_5825, partial [Olpidium bornovanus]